MKKLLYILFTLMVISCGKQQHQSVSTPFHEGGEAGGEALAVTPTIDCLPLYIAQSKGWFKRDSLDLDIKEFTAHMDVDTALVGRSVIGGFTEVKRLEVLEKKYPKIKFDRIMTTPLKWSLITNRMARLNELSQFSEKMVAMTRNSATDFLTDEAFRKEKLKSEFFKVQINDVNVRLQMILCNEMDAAWLPEPQATTAEKMGHKRLLTPKQKFGVWVIRHKYKSIEQKLLKIYNEGQDSILKYGQQKYLPLMVNDQ